MYQAAVGAQPKQAVMLFVALTVWFVISPNLWLLVGVTVLALLLGWHLVASIGGGDMPVVVSMLNSYSGWAAAASGFLLSNDLLIITGALVGSSGAYLSYIMCKAMNRSFISVIAGGFGAEASSGGGPAKEQRPWKRGSAEDAAFLLKEAEQVIIVPGYGMAVAQAQHILREMADLLNLPDEAIVVNVQGDEPLIDPALIDQLASLMAEGTAPMATLAHPIHDAADMFNPNIVKVTLDRRGHALYFSRSAIPFHRDGQAHAPQALRHIGIYGYRVESLRRFPQLPQAPMEVTEALEQLRAMWHGWRIAVHVTDRAPGPGVDTPEDLERVRRLV